MESNARVYSYLKNYYVRNLRPPTMQEIAEGTGYAKGTVKNCMRHLVAASQVRKLDHGGNRNHVPFDAYVIFENDLVGSLSSFEKDTFSIEEILSVLGGLNRGGDNAKRNHT